MNKRFLYIIIVFTFLFFPCRIISQGIPGNGYIRNQQLENVQPKIFFKIKKKDEVRYNENNVIKITGSQIDLKKITLSASTGILVKVKHGWIYKTSNSKDTAVRFIVEGYTIYGRHVEAHFDYKIWGLPG